MENEQNEYTSFFKVSDIFRVMRNNLALTDAFFRYSPLSMDDSESDFNGGFLGVEPGIDHIRIQNQSILTIMIACLYQALENYYDMKRFKPVLEDPELEKFLDNLENRNDFIKSMRLIRNGVFHVNNLDSKTTASITFFDDICGKHGGVGKVMCELRQLLYDFTEKCFSGKLKIFPSTVYETSDEKMDALMAEIQQFQETISESDE